MLLSFIIEVRKHVGASREFCLNKSNVHLLEHTAERRTILDYASNASSPQHSMRMQLQHGCGTIARALSCAMSCSCVLCALFKLSVGCAHVMSR